MRRRLSIIALFSATVLGGCACNGSESGPVATEDTHAVIGHSHVSAVRIHKEEEAIEAARSAVQRLGWNDATFSARPFEDGWDVVARHIVGYDEDGNPITVPGGHRHIRVFASGGIDIGSPGR